MSRRGAILADSAEYKIGRLTLRPRRQLLDGSVPVSIGRKALELLSALAEAEGALVTKDELMAAVWPNAIVEENAIQVHVAALRRALGEDAALLITAHGLGYRLIVTNAAAPPQTIQAAGAEPEAIVPPKRHLRLRALAVFGFAIVIIAAASYAWLRYAGGADQAEKPPTIAVLAFQPSDSSDNARLLADGLAQSVASSLSRYDVTVIAASSSLQLTPAQKPQARALLGADFIIDGRVASDHGKLTVSTQISDTRRNILIYSFDVQGNSALSTVVADRIATHLAFSLDHSNVLDDPTQKFTASDYVLIARENKSFDHIDLPTEVQTSRELAERFPEDGELQASAGFSILMGVRWLPESQQSQAFQMAKADIDRGARLAPGSGLVYLARSMLVNGPLSRAEQERLQRQSMQLSPDFAPTYNMLGDTMVEVGRVDEGVALLQRSVQLNPLSELVNGGAAQDYVHVGREAEATQALARQQAIWPNSPTISDLAIQMATYFGTARDQVAALKKFGVRMDQAGPRPGDADVMLRGEITHDKALTRKSISNCFATYAKSVWQRWDDVCLFMMVERGALDDAFRFADLAYPDLRNRYPPEDVRWLISPPLGLETTKLFTPKMAPFRDDPRFWQVALRTGLISYWQTTQQWPDFCRDQLPACKANAARAVGEGVRPSA